ncbi:MAG: ShlB/FhaC/HecB family hemolysin secretion/activation protein, partial [Rhodocyclaceae bacterium]
VLLGPFALSTALAAEGPPPAPPETRSEAKPSFDIWEYAVEGNSGLPATAIEKAVYPFLGEGRNIDAVELARAALEKAYRDAGFATATVAIPEQPVASGVIRLEVMEGRIDRVRVTGARYFAQGRILEQVPALAEGAPARFPEVEKQLGELNRTADRRVVPVLRPGRLPGTTEVELRVQDQLPLHGGVEINDRYGPSRAPDPSKLRTSFSLRYDNLWQREHSLSLSFLTAPEKPEDARVASISYALPLRSADEVLAIYAVRSRSTSDLSATLPDASVLGSGDIVGLRLSEPIRTVLGLSHSLTFGVDYKRYLEDLGVGGTGSFSTPLTYWLGSIQYSGARPDASGETALGAGLYFSLRGLRDNDEQFAQKRYLGQSNFAVLKWNAQRLQRLPADFQLTARLEGQFSSLPLPSSEQFAIGGADSVRGYPEATQVGDHGIRGMLELRSPRLAGGDNDIVKDLRLLSFIEAGHVRIQDPLPLSPTPDRFTLASLGLGLRLNVWRGFALSLDYGHRLKDGNTQDTHGSVAKGGGRLHFNASYQF